MYIYVGISKIILKKTSKKTQLAYIIHVLYITYKYYGIDGAQKKILHTCICIENQTKNLVIPTQQYIIKDCEKSDSSYTDDWICLCVCLYMIIFHLYFLFHFTIFLIRFLIYFLYKNIYVLYLPDRMTRSQYILLL